MFTPVQLQTHFLMAVGFNAVHRWLERYLVSIPTLVRDYGFGFVVVQSHMEYLNPLGFFDGGKGEARANLKAHLGGAFLRSEFAAIVSGKRIVQGSAVLLPLRIQDLYSLSAPAARLTAPLLSLLQPDEIDAAAPERPLRGVLRTIEQSGREVAESSYEFRVHRHACEYADQWCIIHIPRYVSEAREEMVLAHGDTLPELRRTLERRVRFVNIDVVRPISLFQKGTIHTKAYDVAGSYAFVHRIASADQQHGVVIERFE